MTVDFVDPMDAVINQLQPRDTRPEAQQIDPQPQEQDPKPTEPTQPAEPVQPSQPSPQEPSKEPDPNFDIEKETDVPKYMISLIRTKKCWVHISNNYKLRKRSRSLSCETIHWLCQQIQKGLTQGEILEITTNKRITKNIIQDIRRKRIYKDISKEYGI